MPTSAFIPNSMPTPMDAASSSISSVQAPAAGAAPQQHLSWLDSIMCNMGNTVQQLLQIMLTPVLWYVDAVSSVLRSGVHTAAWLVELAVWWALLPGRVAWWSVMLPFKASAAVWGLIMHSSSSSSREDFSLEMHNGEVRGPMSG
jgi:hypothetical protein